jgi:hypothetical protein
MNKPLPITHPGLKALNIDHAILQNSKNLLHKHFKNTLELGNPIFRDPRFTREIKPNSWGSNIEVLAGANNKEPTWGVAVGNQQKKTQTATVSFFGIAFANLLKETKSFGKTFEQIIHSGYRTFASRQEGAEWKVTSIKVQQPVASPKVMPSLKNTYKPGDKAILITDTHGNASGDILEIYSTLKTLGYPDKAIVILKRPELEDISKAMADFDKGSSQTQKNTLFVGLYTHSATYNITPQKEGSGKFYSFIDSINNNNIFHVLSEDQLKSVLKRSLDGKQDNAYIYLGGCESGGAIN